MAPPGVVLMYGYPPEQRGGGPRCVVYNLAVELHRAGRDVLFVVPALVSKGSESFFGAALQRAAESFHERRLLKSFLPLQDLRALLDRNALLRLGLAGVAFNRVTVVHSHVADLIPHYNDWERDPNNYIELKRILERLSDNTVKLVRTRHEDAQAGLDRLMRLTGIDYYNASAEERLAILEGRVDLKPLVEDFVRANREQLKSQGFSDRYLNEAIDHVWWVVHQFRLWRREFNEVDAVVSLTERGRALMHYATATAESPRSRSIYNGVDHCETESNWLGQRLHDYHTTPALYCYRAGGNEMEGIPFDPRDRKVIYVGRNVRDKGVYELAKALTKLRRSGVRARGIFVGHFDQDQRLEMSAHDLAGSPEYLLFTGPVGDTDELRALYAFGDVTAIPSYYDPFPLVGIESYLAGTPCIVTKGIGAAEAYVEFPNDCGVEIALSVRKPHADGLNRFYGVDTDDLVNQLRQMLVDGAATYRMAEQGARFVREHYSASAMANRYLALYGELESDGPAAKTFSESLLGER